MTMGINNLDGYLLTSGENLLRIPDQMNTSPWVGSVGTTAVQRDDGFELICTGASDPTYSQSMAFAPAGFVYRYSVEARSGNSLTANPSLRMFAYATLESQSLISATIQSKDCTLSDDWRTYFYDVTIASTHTTAVRLTYRLDPGDGSGGGTDLPPAGYSIMVRNPRVRKIKGA